MKKFIILSTVAVALASGKALASNPVCICGTLKEVGSNYVNKAGVQIQTAQSVCFNNAAIYLMISNAVAQGDVSGVSATDLPATGYIVYDPNQNDGALTGTFSVTNKSTHLSFPLSGLDGNGRYYSYMELDTDNQITGILGFDLGPAESTGDDFNDVYSYDAKSQEATSTAVLYIHDNPYAYDSADAMAWAFGFDGSGPSGLSSPNATANNFANSIQIKGIITVSSNSKTGVNSATIHGKGNALINGVPAVVTSSDTTY